MLVGNLRQHVNILTESFTEGMSHMSRTHTHLVELTCNPLGGEKARIQREGGLKFLFITA